MNAGRKGKISLWLAIAAGCLLLVLANVHLVYVALTSQPSCVAHTRAGDGPAGGYSAAQSSCTPN